jgi:hypothetical protein
VHLLYPIRSLICSSCLKEPDGALQSAPIVFVLAHQLEDEEKASDAFEYNYPVGALSLAAVAVSPASTTYISRTVLM